MIFLSWTCYNAFTSQFFKYYKKILISHWIIQLSLDKMEKVRNKGDSNSNISKENKFKVHGIMNLGFLAIVKTSH